MMNIEDELKQGNNVMLVVSSADLKEFALDVISEYEKNKSDTDKMYTADEFAEKHGVTKQTLWRWCREGLLKSRKVGGKVFYRESDLKAL